MTSPTTIIDQRLPTVAIIGRVNVGKSSLFNKLIERNLALVSNIAGTTRTRNVATALWRGKNFRLVDTGGLTFDESVPLESHIIHQTELALQEADIIMFVTDIQDGVLPQEKELAKKLRQLKGAAKKPIILVANKADTAGLRVRVHDREWLALGLGTPLPVSANNGANLGDLLDTIFVHLKKIKLKAKDTKEYNPIRVAIVGKPNVGKSSLFNKLIGEDRVIVSPMAHTTREPHDTLVEYEVEPSESLPPLTKGRRGGVATGGATGEVAAAKRKKKQEKVPILFVDTAGIRRKTKVSGELERGGIGKSLDIINKSDIVLLVLDAKEPITDQDQQLAGLLREHTKSVVIIINKWDAAEGNDDEFRNEVKATIYNSFPHLHFAPIVFTSAKTGYRVHQIYPLIIDAWEARHRELSSEAVRDFIKRTVKKHLPTRGKGVRHPEILGMSQLATNPPIFEILVKPRTSIHISYVHFIENRLREQYNFFACPIVMKLSKLRK